MTRPVFNGHLKTWYVNGNQIWIKCSLDDAEAAGKLKEALRWWGSYNAEVMGEHLRAIMLKARPKKTASQEMGFLLDAAHFVSRAVAVNASGYQEGNDWGGGGRGYAETTDVADALSYAYLGVTDPIITSVGGKIGIDSRITFPGNRPANSEAVSGYHEDYMESPFASPDPTMDQGHHFIMYYWLGIRHPSLLNVALVATGDFPKFKNPGDWNLGVLAHGLGKLYAQSPQYMSDAVIHRLGRPFDGPP